MELLHSDPKALDKLLRTRMPFGKHQGAYLIDLPEPYLVWFASQGFPKGQIGEALQLMYEVKLNGLETMLEPLMKNIRR